MMYSMKTVAALMIMSSSASAFTFSQMPVTASMTKTSNAMNANAVVAQSMSPMISSSSSPTMLFASSSTEEEEATASSTDSNNEIDLLDEVDSIFDSVDTNGDGAISLEELRAHLVDEMGYTKDYTEYLFASIDTDSSGSISKEEMKFAFYNFEALSMYMTFGMGGADITNRKAFKKLALKNAGAALSDSDPEARDKLLLDDLADLIFDIIDTDSSGEISKDELKAHFDSVTSKMTADDGTGENLSATDVQAKEYVQTMFATLDVNNDGGICREEIRTAFEKYDFKLLARTFGLRVYRTAEV